MFRHSAMTLRSHTRLLDSTENGSIVLVSFSGDSPPGSEGNEVAQEMKAVVTAAVNKFHPSAVVFDLSELHYTWGNSISGIFWALLQDTREFLPSCVVATDPTRRALMELIAASRTSIPFKTKFTSGVEEALAHLANRSRRNES
jgi:hypothetical protein